MTAPLTRRALQLTAAYKKYLNRIPDSVGLAGWVGVMEHGLTDETLEAYFIGSPEYIANHGGPGAGWITGLYQDLLGRTPTASEVNTWVVYRNQGGSTFTVALLFAASPERETIRVQNDYQTYLGRAATQTEVNAWVVAFANHQITNEDVIAGFVGSPEYFVRHYNNVEDWLFSAYADVLSRQPDGTSYAAWLAFLGRV